MYWMNRSVQNVLRQKKNYTFLRKKTCLVSEPDFKNQWDVFYYSGKQRDSEMYVGSFKALKSVNKVWPTVTTVMNNHSKWNCGIMEKKICNMKGLTWRLAQVLLIGWYQWKFTIRINNYLLHTMLSITQYNNNQTWTCIWTIIFFK